MNRDLIPEYDPDAEYLMPADTAAAGEEPRQLTDDEIALIALISARGGDLHRKSLAGNKPMLAALRTLVADGFVYRSKWAGHFILFDRHNLPKDTDA